MATQVQNRRGTTAEHSAFTGAVGEVTIDTDKDTVVVHDGSTAGGRPLLREDQSNLPTSAPTRGIYNASGSLALSTNGTGRLFVDASGRVGVGSAPSVGNGIHATINTNSYGTALVLQNANVNGWAAEMQFLGITTTDTQAKIGAIASGPGTNSGALAFYTANAGSYSERLRITSTGQLSHIGAGSAVSPAVSFNGSAPSNSLVVDSLGRVSIGTSSPSANLDVTGTTATIRAGSTLNTDGAFLRVCENQFQGGYFKYDGSTNLIHIGSHSSADTNTASDENRITIVRDTGNVGIGTTSPDTLLHIKNSSTGNLVSGLKLKNEGIAGSAISIDFDFFATSQAASRIVGLRENSSNFATALAFYTAPIGSGAGEERARIDSSGRLLVGTSSALSAGGNSQYGLIQVEGNSASGNGQGILTLARGTAPGSITTGQTLGMVVFSANNGGEYGEIRCEADGAGAVGDYPGRLTFSTTADGASSPTERMRITSGGVVGIGVTSPALAYTDAVGVQFSGSGYSVYNRDGGALAFFNRRVSDGSAVEFARSGTGVGSISVTTTATAYNTSSDYRLKENVTPVTDGITRLQQLKPSRFNFIAEPGKTVDGFIAHEVQTVVPEAITGEKDAVDDEGNPEYQGIDQSKLVPLLTAALQEAIAKIETLEAKVAALESA